MTPQEAIVWKRELAESLEAVIESFNLDRIREGHPEHIIETFDAIGKALGIKIVKPQYPSCHLELELELGRHPAVVIRCSRRRAAHVQRVTEEKYSILSPPDSPLSVDDIDHSLTADEFSEVIIGLFPVPQN